MVQPPLTRDDFEYWLFAMSDRLDDLFAQLPKEVSRSLDYTVVSLNTLEAWILEHYPSMAALLALEEKETLDALGSYIGETLRKQAGGKWDIDLTNPKNAYYLKPVIVQAGIFTECPLTLATACTDRRTGHYISGVVSYLVNKATTKE